MTPLKRFVYLISPEKINKNFYNSLDKVLSYGNVEFFQLRLKKIRKNSILKIAIKIKKITQKHKVKFIVNDDYILASKIKTEGCHLGQLDGSIKAARNKLKKKIYDYYLKKNNKIKAKKFKIDFDILSVLRNLKIIGIFMRLATRDNKKKYLKLIPYAWEMIDYRISQNKVFGNLRLLLNNNFSNFIG